MVDARVALPYSNIALYIDFTKGNSLPFERLKFSLDPLATSHSSHCPFINIIDICPSTMQNKTQGVQAFLTLVKETTANDKPHNEP
jgi:hypothetical protein